MIRYFVGSIGSGKTTMAVKFALQEMYGKHFTIVKALFHNVKCGKDKVERKNIVYCNYDNTMATRKFDAQELANRKPCEYAYVQIDESGLEFNSREFKTLKKGIIEYFKLSRHNHNNVDIFSQTFDDTDKMIRDLASEIWLLKRCGPFTVARKVVCSIGIDKDTKQLKFMHEFIPIWHQLLPFQPKQFKFCFRPFYYRFFNSFSPVLRNEIDYTL